MRVRIHHPLFAGFLGVVVLMLLLVVWMVGGGLRRGLMDLSRAALERELQLARMVVEVAPAGADADSLAGALTARIRHRTTIIALDGTVLGDSDVLADELGGVENHADRPEVEAARARGVGFAQRESVTRDMPFLYGAVPARLGGDDVVLRLAAPLDDIRATLARGVRGVVVAGLLATLGALVAAYLVSRALARPLVTLSERARDLARGDFTRRVPHDARVEELDELASAFNRLADELQARLRELGHERDEMQALIDCMAEGVVALTDDARILRTNRAARELLRVPAPPTFAPVSTVVRQPELRALLEESVVHAVQARELVLDDHHLIVSSRMLDQGGAVTTFLDVTEIRRLEQVRRDFVANASHELKTPLTSIRGFAETLLEDDPPEHLEREFLNAIRVNTVRLQHLVDDLLDLSRLESGGWVAHRERVDLGALAHDVWTDLIEGRGAAAGLEFDIQVEIEGEGLALADDQGVQQILRNLLDNAVRSMPDGGRIDVVVRQPGPERVDVEVRDAGVGIPTRVLPRIFERFYRADTSRARAGGGTGLGLAIVRHLVHAMGGEVWATSELGRGTVVGFSLPVWRANAGAPNDADNADDAHEASV
jgi:two-component system phosphate regulon sensor histidine kinase PhoR